MMMIPIYIYTKHALWFLIDIDFVLLNAVTLSHLLLKVTGAAPSSSHLRQRRLLLFPAENGDTPYTGDRKFPKCISNLASEVS